MIIRVYRRPIKNYVENREPTNIEIRRKYRPRSVDFEHYGARNIIDDSREVVTFFVIRRDYADDTYVVGGRKIIR